MKNLKNKIRFVLTVVSIIYVMCVFTSCNKKNDDPVPAKVEQPVDTTSNNGGGNADTTSNNPTPQDTAFKCGAKLDVKGKNDTARYKICYEGSYQIFDYTYNGDSVYVNKGGYCIGCYDKVKEEYNLNSNFGFPDGILLTKDMFKVQSFLNDIGGDVYKEQRWVMKDEFKEVFKDKGIIFKELILVFGYQI